MAHVLVVFATTEGHTRKIADRVSARLSAAGHEVSLVDARTVVARELGEFDAAVLAASLHVGLHQKEMVQFIRNHRARLERVPTAFVSVSLAASSKQPRDLETARMAVDEMFDELDWMATRVHLAAGAVDKGRLGLFRQWVLQRVLRDKDVALPDNGEAEYTDWPALDNFVLSFMTQGVELKRAFA